MIFKIVVVGIVCCKWVWQEYWIQYTPRSSTSFPMCRVLLWFYPYSLSVSTVSRHWHHDNHATAHCQWIKPDVHRQIHRTNPLINGAITTTKQTQHHNNISRDILLIGPWIKSMSNELDITFRARVKLSRNAFVTSSAIHCERTPIEWDMGWMCENHRFYRHLWIRYVL